MVGCWNLGLKMIPTDRPRSSLGPQGISATKSWFRTDFLNFRSPRGSRTPGPLRNVTIVDETNATPIGSFPAWFGSVGSVSPVLGAGSFRFGLGASADERPRGGPWATHGPPKGRPGTAHRRPMGGPSAAHRLALAGLAGLAASRTFASEGQVVEKRQRTILGQKNRKPTVRFGSVLFPQVRKPMRGG